MELPLTIRAAWSGGPVLSVDGAFDAPGLNLSHWPGNTTPEDLRHDLSTGSALRFAALSPEERARRTEGCVAIVNNHVDTDGVCAMFAVAHPELALRHADRLLAAAEAGDFFRPRDEDALALDALISACLDAERAPWRADTAGLDDDARHEHDLRELVRRLPAWLESGIEEHAALWRPVVEDWRADRADLQEAALDDLAHLDFAVWTAPDGFVSTRTHAPTHGFDPGRQAFFSAHFADRVLLVGPSADGTTYRLVLSTLSWFDQSGRACLARPDLDALTATLNALESTDPERDAAAWRAQSAGGASPELWFGAAGMPSFPEHAGEFLRPSRLDPTAVRARVLDALRATWQFPED